MSDADALFDIAGRRVLVAGGAAGLGESICHALAGRGAVVAVADRDGEQARQVAASLPGEGHQGIEVDIADEEAVEMAIARVVDGGEPLHVLVNSAGVADFGPALTLEKARFERTIAVNLTGAFLLSRCAARHMVARGEGSIIHLASVSSKVVNPEYSAYSPSKAGLSQLVRILALEWAEKGVRVNAIGPAMTETPLTRATVLADEEGRTRALAKIPMGRFGRPEDLFGMVVLLASPAGSFITGQTLFVDGGRTLL